jgi:hypothetical protein
LKREFPPKKRGGAPAPKSEPCTGAAFPPKRLAPKLILEFPNMLPLDADDPPVAAVVLFVSPNRVVEPKIDPLVA